MLAWRQISARLEPRPRGGAELSDARRRPLMCVRAQPKADTFQSHYRKAEPWGLRFLIESLLWERDRALPNVLERNMLVLPARLEIPVGKIRRRSPIPF